MTYTSCTDSYNDYMQITILITGAEPDMTHFRYSLCFFYMVFAFDCLLYSGEEHIYFILDASLFL